MRFLLFVSCCWSLLCLWCSPVFPMATCLQDPEPETLFFNAVIEVSGKTVSGIMVLNREDSSRYRMLFTTIAGPKLLDMDITAIDYQKNYCIKQLDRKVILKFFQKDFAMVTGLLRGNPGTTKKTTGEDGGWVEEIPVKKKDTVKYFLAGETFITKAQYNSKKKQLFEATYSYVGNKLESITIQHFNFSMHITLNRFEP